MTLLRGPAENKFERKTGIATASNCCKGHRAGFWATPTNHISATYV